jgi:acyl-CoA thioester hydrolase
MNYLVVSKKHQKVAAEGDGVIVTFNYKEGQKVTVPEVVKQGIFDIEKSVTKTVKSNNNQNKGGQI